MGLSEDEIYMKMAIGLAEKGRGRTSPNPVVGAVIVKDSRVIGRGFHGKYGGLHAEREALGDCDVSPCGATMYVTLEPCCHHGKQPPCTDAIIEAGIGRVVIGSADPNPLVAGKGVDILRKKGIAVTEGVMKEDCDAINKAFFHMMETGRPYVMMKYAMTIDGKVAAHTGMSQWITCGEAREEVHRDRGMYAAVMTGIGTVLGDDPLLTCRVAGGRNPVRVICDTHMRLPEDSAIVKTSSHVRTIVAVGDDVDDEKKKRLDAAGCEIWKVPQKGDRIDLVKLMERLGEAGIDSVMMEGGPTLNWAALEAGIVSKVKAYIAPKVMGGESAPTPVSPMGRESAPAAVSPVGGTGAPSPDDTVMLSDIRWHCVGDDIVIEGEVRK